MSQKTGMANAEVAIATAQQRASQRPDPAVAAISSDRTAAIGPTALVTMHGATCQPTHARIMVYPFVHILPP